ncbi:MAG: YqgE/AlgH family protein [Dehalococcoidia bacterium]
MTEFSTGALTGKLLVATPLLTDPNFDRTVIFMCAHEDEGAFGVVINRPTESDVIDHVPDWHRLAASPAVIYAGGPVDLEGAIALGRVAEDRAQLAGGEADGEAGSEGGIETLEGWTAVTSQLGFVDVSRSPEQFAAAGLEQMRLFSGHAGWGADQLAAEIEEEAWFVVDAEPGDPFTREPERLWSEVLRRQPGRLAIFADYPRDVSVN